MRRVARAWPQIGAIAELLSERKCLPGQTIVHQGVEGDALFVVQSGTCGCYIATPGSPGSVSPMPNDAPQVEAPAVGTPGTCEGGSTGEAGPATGADAGSAGAGSGTDDGTGASPGGGGGGEVDGAGRMLVKTVHRGEAFGELTLLDRARKTAASVLAEEHTTLLVLPREQFSQLCAVFPEFLQTLAENTEDYADFNFVREMRLMRGAPLELLQAVRGRRPNAPPPEHARARTREHVRAHPKSPDLA